MFDWNEAFRMAWQPLVQICETFIHVPLIYCGGMEAWMP